MNGSKRPPLDENLALFRASIAAEGTTTDDSLAPGTSFIDAALKGAGANSFDSMLAVLYPGDPQKVDSKSITGFNNGTGEVTLVGAYKGGIAPIPAGVPYKILTFRLTAADVATLTALVTKFQGLCYYGVVTAATLPNQFTIPTLAGFGDTAFCNWIAYVFWDTAGVDAAPQRESQPVATYGSATGIFTAPGFTAAVDVGDIVLILHPRIAQILGSLLDIAADIGDASGSTLHSLYAILGNPEAALGDSMTHVPKYTGGLLYVDGDNGDDVNSGQEPDIAKETIGAAIAVASPGDRIRVKAGTYDEALVMNKAGLELICEQGTVLINTAGGGGTPLVVGPADYQRVVGAILLQAGEIGIQITGNYCSIEDCLAYGSSVGFDDDGLETHLKNCRSILHTTTGFDISGGYGQYERCVAAGGGVAVRGVYLSNAAANYNHFFDCHTLGNAAPGAGWEADADNNLFSHCSTGAGDGVKVDAGTNNTWDDFSEGSIINPGQTRDQDLKDIYDKVYKEQIPDTDFDGLVTDTETECVPVDLAYTASKTYCLRHLRLKCADPGAGRTVTVKLYERWNDTIAQLIDSFDITSDNYETYHSLMDMFGVPEIHSDAIRIRAVHDGTSPGDDKAIEVTYRYAEATT